ncbi:acylphosphatase [Nesterenkonia xinjiangensis]|uniref:acylphosphatase n=1 Tax=Nesterenkonia xinjiangensis TaxID=225327 RepID=A0A7Z0GJ97_9MICC|nr:D-alanine-D-alanine ligase-like ATP-grasp enzyme/L-alanine-DL-glutamate epimerase-like enolase superfamily enzyme/acylphosphatase [Nesterenkonia xinjiangensis]
MEITRARAFSYKVPGQQKVTTNHVVTVTATDGAGITVEGVGEGQPRAALTGDSAEESWAFLEAMLDRLHGRSLQVGSPAQALEQVRSIMDEFFDLAAEMAHDPGLKRPFRGTLLGVEVALLDFFACAAGISLHELLGDVRESAPVFPSLVKVRPSVKELRRSLRQQAGRHERLRVKAARTVGKTLDRLEILATVSRSRAVGQDELPLWVECGGQLERERATTLVEEVTRSMVRGHLPAEVILEQPVPARFGDHLPLLQRRADEIVDAAGGGPLKLTVLGDESIWDQHSLGRLRKLGGLRGVTVRPAQSGGLLPAIDLAQAALRQSEDAVVMLSRMDGAGWITKSAIQHLALALPVVHGVQTTAFRHSDLPFARWRDHWLQFEELEGEEELETQEGLRWTDDDESATENGLAWAADEDDEVEDSSEAEVLEEEPAAAPGALDLKDQRLQMAPVRPAADCPEVQIVQTTAPRKLPGHGIGIDYGPLVSEVRRFAQAPPFPEPRNEGRLPARYEHVEDVRPLGPNGTKGYLLEKRALARGLSTTRYSKSAFVAFDGDHPPVNFKWSRSPISSAVALSVCTHKEATRLMLEDAGVPTPQGRTFRNGDFDSARAFVEVIGFPVVVKPSMGIRGIGVIAGIETPGQLEDAFSFMADSRFGGQDFIVEKHIHGRDHRILVVGGEVVAAIQRKPASVVGDGRSSIAELLIHRNVARRSNPHLWTRPAKIDRSMELQLAKLGLPLASVLPEGREVILSNTANISQGADSIDVFDTLHPSIVEACERAVAAVPGMQYCGVDFLLEDPSRSLPEQDAAIIELNAHAAIGNCEYPMFGTGRPVAQRLMDLTIEQKGLRVSEPQDQLAVHLTVRGRVTNVGFRKWMHRLAERAKVQGWVRNLDSRTLEAVLSGPTERVTPLVASCIVGPARAIPTSYNATVIPTRDATTTGTGFEIRPRPSAEELSAQEREEMSALARADDDDSPGDLRGDRENEETE